MKKIPPPFYAFIGIGLQYVLDRFMPLVRFDSAESQMTAAGFGIVAFVLMVWAIGSFLVRRTTVIPHGTPSALVIRGPYRFTRNPMYLGLALFLCGSGLWFGSVAPLVVPVLFGMLITRLFIRMEEQVLQTQFGAAYTDYKKRVGRWL